MIEHWLFGLLICGVSGTILTAGWLLFREFLRFSPNTRAVYFLLRCVMVGYLVPVGYLLLRIQERASGWSGGYIFLLSEKQQWIIILLFAAWLTGVVISVGRYVIQRIHFQQNLQDRMPGTLYQQKVLKDVCDLLQIRREIRVCQKYDLPTPFIIGVFHPTVYLPVMKKDELSEAQLRMIYLHELTHYRQRDIFWKPFFGIVCFLFFFFYPAIWGYREMEKWAEHCCDRVCCKYYEPVEYFEMIQKVCKTDRRVGVRFVSMWAEKESELMKRATYIRAAQSKPQVKTGIKTAAVLLFCISIIGAGATTYSAMNLHDQIFYSTADKTIEAEDDFVDDNLPEYTGTMDDFAGMTMESDEEIQGMVRTLTSIDWKLRKNVTRKTIGFKASKGGTIRVILSMDPSNKNISVGIIQPDTSLRYVRASNEVAHSFSLTQTGTYYVYVSNTNSVTVQVVGSYKR